MSKYLIISFCYLWSFNFVYTQTKSSISTPDASTNYLKQFAPSGVPPHSSAYFQTDLIAIKKVEAQMQAQDLGGVEDAPTYLQPGSIVLFKTNGGNFGKMQILSFGQREGNPAELYIRYSTFKPDGSILKTSEFMDLLGTKSGKSEYANSGNSGSFTLDTWLAKGITFTKFMNIRKSAEVDHYGSFYWSINNGLLFLKPSELIQYLVKNPDGESQVKTPSNTYDVKELKDIPASDRPLSKPQRRLALIIGNAAYPSATLRNPVNDATDIATALREMGFVVITSTNSNRQKMEAAIDDFGTRLKNYDLGFFYYAGHGVQIDGENYLIPIDAALKSQGEVKYECYPVGKLLAKMDEAANQANVIVLDACRDNPFARGWSRSLISGGLANISAPQGTFIGFATAPGSTAADGDGRNGVYTTALLEHLRKPNLTIDQLFNAVSGSVKKKTNNQQIPWKASSLSEDLYLRN